MTLAFLLVVAQFAQFDAASVKPNKSGDRAMNDHFGPAQASWTNFRLRILIQTAYGIQDYQLIGAPVWADSDAWDIDARSAAPTTTAQKMEMLQALLADRFHLKLHRETRDLPQYRLTVAKNGPKLTNANASDLDRTLIKRGVIENPNITADALAGWLKGELGRPVTDDTHLTGHYSIKLAWSPDERQPNSQGATDDTPGTSIFAALQEQLGLKLEPYKGPLEVLVIDRVEKPSAN
jgi:uncharacterized protein (TIGR03435 family)